MSSITDKICITGGSGYIGGQTAILLKEHGYKICVVDPEPLPQQLEPFVDQFVKSRASDAIDVCSEFDKIVFCAGSSLVGPSMSDPGHYYWNNTGELGRFLEQISKSNWQGKLVFSSSASVYGNTDLMPLNETRSQLLPMNPYGTSKLFCERVLTDSVKAYNFTAISLRYFNVCGADLQGRHGQPITASHIFPKLFSAMSNNLPFQIRGNNYNTPDGTCVRDYIHVVDIADAHRVALENNNSTDHQIFNLGTGQGISNLQIVQSTELVLNKKINYEVIDIRLGDPGTLIADAQSFQLKHNWQPKYSQLEEIISSLSKWYHK